MTRMAASGQDNRSRVLLVLTGVLLGAAWGSILWAITGQNSGARGWAYAAFGCAMLGAGVAAFFGAAGARKRGERISPRWKRK